MKNDKKSGESILAVLSVIQDVFPESEINLVSRNNEETRLFLAREKKRSSIIKGNKVYLSGPHGFIVEFNKTEAKNLDLI